MLSNVLGGPEGVKEFETHVANWTVSVPPVMVGWRPGMTGHPKGTPRRPNPDPINPKESASILTGQLIQSWPVCTLADPGCRRQLWGFGSAVAESFVGM